MSLNKRRGGRVIRRPGRNIAKRKLGFLPVEIPDIKMPEIGVAKAPRRHKSPKENSGNNSDLYIDEEDFERVFEIRIRDLRERKGVKQKSFSISVKKGVNDGDYIDVDNLKKQIQKAVKDVKK
jgi:hypothetical protein